MNIFYIVATKDECLKSFGMYGNPNGTPPLRYGRCSTALCTLGYAIMY